MLRILVLLERGRGMRGSLLKETRIVCGLLMLVHAGIEKILSELWMLVRLLRMCKGRKSRAV